MLCATLTPTSLSHSPNFFFFEKQYFDLVLQEALMKTTQSYYKYSIDYRSKWNRPHLTQQLRKTIISTHPADEKKVINNDYFIGTSVGERKKLCE